MKKPFNFEEFKAGKPAVINGVKIEFIAYDEDFNYPVLCKETYNNSSKGLHQCTIKYLQDNATMIPTKRTVWIAIGKRLHDGFIEPFGRFSDTKEIALSYNIDGWKVIDAIPYEIEE